MAETIELGIVGIKNCGEYNSETHYEKLNVVTYQGSSYCALRDTVGNLPTDTDYWQLYAKKGDPSCFDNVTSMKNDTTLIAGSFAQTLGYYSIDDNGGAYYIIKEQEIGEIIDEGQYIQLNNGLIAKLLLENYLTPEQFGAKGDNTTDDSDCLIKMFNTHYNLYSLTKNYKISKELNISGIPSGSIIKGGGKIYATSSPERSRRNIFKLSDANNITIDNLTFESINNQSPYIPSGHSARTGSLSSNIIAINLYKVKNSHFTNLNFINMCFDFHVQGHEENSYGNENIYLNNLVDTGGATGIYADNINNLVINNYYMKPYDNPVGGMHMFYIARYVGKVNISNVILEGNSKTDIVFDFANFFDEDDNSSFNSEIYVDGFNITANGLISVKRKAKNIELLNGIFNCTYQITENNSNQYGFVCNLFHEYLDEILTYPTIKFNNVEFNYIQNETKECYLFQAASPNYGKAIFKNCVINNIPVQYSNSDIREEVEFYNCIIDDTLKLGVFKSSSSPVYQDKDLVNPYGKYINCNIIMSDQYIFSTRYNTRFKLFIEKNIIHNNSGVSMTVLYNGDSNSGDLTFARNDYYTTGNSYIGGLTNTQAIIYDNYRNGELYTT